MLQPRVSVVHLAYCSKVSVWPSNRPACAPRKEPPITHFLPLHIYVPAANDLCLLLLRFICNAIISALTLRLRCLCQHQKDTRVLEAFPTKTPGCLSSAAMPLTPGQLPGSNWIWVCLVLWQPRLDAPMRERCNRLFSNCNCWAPHSCGTLPASAQGPSVTGFGDAIHAAAMQA